MRKHDGFKPATGVTTLNSCCDALQSYVLSAYTRSLAPPTLPEIVAGWSLWRRPEIVASQTASCCPHSCPLHGKLHGPSASTNIAVLRSWGHVRTYCTATWTAGDSFKQMHSEAFEPLAVPYTCPSNRLETEFATFVLPQLAKSGKPSLGR